jgi:hypothetical protein
VDVAGILRRRISIQIYETRVTHAYAGHERHRRTFARRKPVHDDLDYLSYAGNVTERAHEWNGATRTALGDRKLHVGGPYGTVRIHLVRVSGAVIEMPANDECRDHGDE